MTIPKTASKAGSKAAPKEPKAKVRITVADLLDQAIEGLKVEVRCAERVWYRGQTTVSGLIEFQAEQGRDLYISVKRWTRDEMKTVARFFTGKDDIALKLISPKVKINTQGAARGEAGSYVRGTYTVKPGETLGSIGKRVGIGTEYLAHINGIKDVNRISVGQVLKVPPVKNRNKAAQPHAPAPAHPPHRADTNAPPATRNATLPVLPALGQAPDVVQKHSANGNPVTVVQYGQAAVIFPLLVKPLNESGGEFAHKSWRPNDAVNAACFGRPRGGGRLHAGRDLYAEDYTPVVAVAPGKVLAVRGFYMQTDQVTVSHTTSDGRRFVVRYGELDPASIAVKPGEQVLQGQLLGKTGILRKKDGSKLIVTDGKNVSMLHFELFTGAQGLDRADNLSNDSRPYNRRADITDGLALLQEGFINTFREGASTLPEPGERKPIASLSLSEAGLAFIKDYEKLRLDYYDDSEGYCTVGWGQLVGGKRSCASQGIPVGDKITREQADIFLDKSIKAATLNVNISIQSDLFQHEFDALVSLAFNVGSIGKKAPSLCKKINKGQYNEAASEFLDITNGGNRGLIKRRNQENAMFLRADYTSTH